MLTPRGSGWLAIPLLVALAGCAGVAANAEQRSRVKCGYVPPPDGFVVPGRVVLLGEFHGTRELPEAFGELVCHAASGAPVRVGLPLPQGEAERLERFFSLPNPSDRDALLRGSPFWTSPRQDGRSSRAMLTLLTRLGKLKAAGLPVQVFAFDADPPLGPDREQRMADTVAAEAHADPDGRMLLLTGSLDARTAPGGPDPAWRSMGALLAEAGLDVVAFDFGGPPGTAWSCQDQDPAHCGGGTLQPGNPPGPPGLAPLPRPTPEGFAGRWSVPSLTASPPAYGETP